MSESSPASGPSSSAVANLLESIKRERREQEARSREFEDRVRRPARSLRGRWNAEWSGFLSALRNSGLDEAGIRLSRIGELVREQDELDRTAQALSPSLADAAAASVELRPPTRAERLDALSTDARFYSYSPVVGAGLLSAAVNGQSPARLTELLREVIGDEDTKAAVCWFPFFRDRLLPPLGHEVRPGVYTCEEADPEDNWYVHDYQRASTFMTAWAYLREGQRFELDSEGEPTCLVMGRLRAQEIEEIRRQTEAAEEPALEPPHSHPVPPPIRTEKGEGGAPKPSAGRATRDPNQPARDRQNDILATIRNAGSPQTRPELIKAMRLKSEGKLGAHLAWMVKNKILINIPRQGYWPAGEPVPE